MGPTVYCVSEVNDGLTPMDKIAIINLFKNDYTAVQTYITLLKHHCGTHGVCFSYPGAMILLDYQTSASQEGIRPTGRYVRERVRKPFANRFGWHMTPGRSCEFFLFLVSTLFTTKYCPPKKSEQLKRSASVSCTYQFG